MSINDDGLDLADPVTETRGGENPDWEKSRPGQPLPEKEPYQGRHRKPEQDRLLRETGAW